MLAVRLPEDLETRLAELASRTGRSKSFYVRQAIATHIEDLEDIYLAEHALEELQAGRDTARPLSELVDEYK